MPTMRADSVTNFLQVAQQLIQEAAEYVGAGEYSAEADANIRKLRLVSNALNAALQMAQVPMPISMPATPAVAAPAPAHPAGRSGRS